jgi:hypothetical protein
MAVEPFFTSIATSLAGELLKQAGRAGFAALRGDQQQAALERVWAAAFAAIREVARWWP